MYTIVENYFDNIAGVDTLTFQDAVATATTLESALKEANRLRLRFTCSEFEVIDSDGEIV